MALPEMQKKAGSDAELGGSWFDPFLDLHLDYSAGVPRLIAGSTGLAASVSTDTTLRGRKRQCPDQDGANPYRNRVTP